MWGKRFALWEKAQQQRRDSDSLLLPPHPLASSLFMIAAPIAGVRSRFVIPSVTKHKKPSSKKTSRDKKSYPGNLAPESTRAEHQSRAPEESTSPAPEQESRRAGEHRHQRDQESTGPEQEQEQEHQSTGTGSAWLASWHRHCKLAFQAGVSNKRCGSTRLVSLRHGKRAIETNVCFASRACACVRVRACVCVRGGRGCVGAGA